MGTNNMTTKMKIKHAISIQLIVSLAVVAFSTTAIAAPEVEHWVTQNGARVYFVPAKELPIVDIQVVFDAGAARDGDQPGLAVMTNGLLAEGAGKLNSDQISERFESLGAAFSNSSHRDMAVLGLRSLSDREVLDPAVDLLSTVITQPSFPADAFEREQKNVLISIEQSKQSPSAISGKAFFSNAYPGHAYGTQPTGTTESISALTTADLSKYYDKYYVARNAVIALVGNLDRAAAEKLAEQIIGQLPEGVVADSVSAVDNISAAKTIEISHPSAQTHIIVGQPGVSRGDPDYFSLYVGNHILGGSGLVSRLSQEVREKRGLSYSTYSYFSPMRQNGPFMLGLQTQNDSAQEALNVLMAEVEKYVKEGPTEKELIAAKKNITGGFPLRISSNKKIISYIAMIGFYGLPLDYMDTFNQHITAVTTQEIKEAFQKRVKPDKMITVLVGGAKKT